MTLQDLSSRQKSQRLINRMKSETNNYNQQFQIYKQRSKNINNIIELLPGLNDISDAFEALPLDLIKYFTLLKEIDAKCINTIPQINLLIDKYIRQLHENRDEQLKNGGNMDETVQNSSQEKPNSNPSEFKSLSIIKNKINEIVPCLEEKMQVTRVATDLLSKHMFRINQDYKLIIKNNEIPESIRIGPLNHPAMITDLSSNSNGSNSNSSNNATNQDRTAQAARSESRREALAAKKASKEEETKRRGGKESTPYEKTPPESPPMNSNYNMGNNSGNSNSNNNSSNNMNNNNTNNMSNTNNNNYSNSKKRGRQNDEMFRSTTPSNGNNKRKKSIKSNDDDDESDGKLSKPSSTPKSSGEREQTYCYCNQVSFGDMVGCDGDDCKREWFHLPCIGFKNAPKGKWYCDDCLIKMKKVKRI